jgi:ribosomal protein S18 acetylase RimI-like enzyme
MPAPADAMGAGHHAGLLMAQAETGALLIRDPEAGDEAVWRRLWDGYVEFYQSQVREAVTAATWARLLDSNSGMIGRLAELDGAVVGFTVSVLHPGSWTLEPTCYLEDLFVDPAARGRGIGKGLIDDLVGLGRARGWSRLYWHTHASNDTARRLYNRYVEADGFVRYRLFLT